MRRRFNVVIGEPIHTPDVTHPSGTKPARGTRNQAAILQLVTEVIALESQIEQSTDRHVGLPLQHPAAAAAIRQFHRMTLRQRDALKAHLATLGGTEAHPMKDAVAKLADVAASAIDSARPESVSTVLRDEYVMFNHAAVAYSMLHTTAHALEHAETADIASRHLSSYAAAVQQINQLMPEVVVWELEKQGFTTDRGAAKSSAEAINRAWRDTATVASRDARRAA
jgi:hypothetical protein